MSKVRASIIVTLNNEYALSKNFFEHLLRVAGEAFEIIAVLDGPTDHDRFVFLHELAAQAENLHLIHLPENKGFSKANNVGAHKASSDLLIFLNSDTFPEKGSLELLADAIEGDSSIGAAQGMILYPQTNAVQSCGHVFGFYKTQHAYDGLPLDTPIVHQTADRQALASAFTVTPRELFFSFGGFDETYYNAWDGLEYTLKVHLSGHRCVYLPKPKAYHVKGSGRNRLYRDESYQAGYFWHKWGSKIQMDVHYLWKAQLQPQWGGTFTLVNASGIPTYIWHKMLRLLDFQCTTDFSVPLSLSQRTTSIEDSVPYSLLEASNSILFLTVHYKDVVNNWRLFQYRSTQQDVILDLHGNVICPQIYHQTLGSK